MLEAQNYMRFYREKIEETRDEQNKLDENSRGMQPKIVYDCFLALELDDDSRCTNCKNYLPKCRGHLIMFQIPVIIGDKEVRET